MAEPQTQKRDLNLAEGFYAFFQDNTTGVIKVYCGNTVVTPTAQETPVRYDPNSGDYIPCILEESKRKSIDAREGQYVVLKNPEKDGKKPETGTVQKGASLESGRSIIIPGPVKFALWPGQTAEIIDGHQLRSNQYLLVRVYNEELAKKNWSEGVMQGAGAEAAATKAPPELNIGKLLIIKGADVSFYIPPTGIEVIPNDDSDAADQYVRDALTLERLDYAILVDEDGNKRYEKGPSVVFPEPTEKFVEVTENVKGQSIQVRKFRAIELTPIKGIHIKVIADYDDEVPDNAPQGAEPTHHKAGEELFLTGKDTAIYYPREEHSAIKYDGKVTAFATAVPAGEARYVMNRLDGKITKVEGPAMLLPDPRTQVIVRRVLSDKQCMNWYPGNAEALAYNQKLRQVLSSAPATVGAVREGDVERGMKGATLSANQMRKSLGGDAEVQTRGLVASAMNYASTQSFMESSAASKDQGLAGDEFSRNTSYTPPRTVTLDTKYLGAPAIEVWTGYAVLVVSKTGSRKVVVGPKTILLDYDESLEVLQFSTGKPKTTDNLERSVYLRVENNKVADIVRVETSDHVEVELRLSYLVNFDGDNTRWFSVENYVKFLCDHVRSVLKGATKKVKVEDFYANSTDFIRDTLLGKSIEKERAGMYFTENNMVVADVEVLGTIIVDPSLRELLEKSQHEVVKTNVEVSNLRRGLEVDTLRHEVKRKSLELVADTTKKEDAIQRELAESKLVLALVGIGNKLKEAQEQLTLDEQIAAVEMGRVEDRAAREQIIVNANLAKVKADQELKVALLKAETEAVVARFKEATGGFSEALLALSNNETMVKVAEAWNIQRAIGGESVADAIQKVFTGTPLGDMVKKLTNGAKSATPRTLGEPPRV
jgi:major vault protein